MLTAIPKVLLKNVISLLLSPSPRHFTLVWADCKEEERDRWESRRRYAAAHFLLKRGLTVIGSRL
jgi:hypothetical protein